MTTAYTPQFRFIQPSIGTADTKNTWGTLLNTDMSLVEQAIAGVVTVSVNGLSSLTLTASNGASDQSRPYAIIFTGTPSGSPASCTVTIPSVIKFGLVQNQAIGTVVLTTGAGNTLSLLGPNNGYAPYACDGTNVFVPGAGSQSSGVALYDGRTISSFTWTVPPGAVFAEWELWGVGGAGGAVASFLPGGGGGGGGYAKVAWPVTPGLIFTGTLGAVGSSASTIVNQSTYAAGVAAGAAGVAGGVGGAGGAFLISVPGGATYVAYDGMPGQAGQLVPGGSLAVGGAGGASGWGNAGGAAFIAATTGTNAPPNVTNVGGGGVGATNTTGGPGNGGPSLVTVRWWNG
jgi:hypothetical protein